MLDKQALLEKNIEALKLTNIVATHILIHHSETIFLDDSAVLSVKVTI